MPELEESDMATVYDVAKYILNKMGSTTTMKLEKLAYYCQAWSLAWDEKPRFDEDFQAWANGPVCPSLFAAHRGQFVVNESLFSEREDYKFTEDEVEAMNAVLDYYGDKEPQWLSELTHKERPWREARDGIAPGEPSNNVITKESMQEYYGGLQ